MKMQCELDKFQTVHGKSIATSIRHLVHFMPFALNSEMLHIIYAHTHVGLCHDVHCNIRDAHVCQLKYMYMYFLCYECKSMFMIKYLKCRVQATMFAILGTAVNYLK